jgi:hypothetical protein
MARRFRLLLIALIGVLYLISVPWYREAGEAPAIWFGLPDWVAVALGCYLAAAALNAVAWLITDVPDDGPPSDPTGADASR